MGLFPRGGGGHLPPVPLWRFGKSVNEGEAPQVTGPGPRGGGGRHPPKCPSAEGGLDDP